MIRSRFVLLLVILGCTLSTKPAAADDQSGATAAPIKIGWIGPLTGSNVKWGSRQAVQLALEEINAGGGVNGRPVELVFEDGKGSGKDAAGAAQKLIGADGVKFILGGHCSPESLAIAPIVERSGSLMIAAVTSNPYLTSAGDHVFRVTAISTAGTEQIYRYARGRGLNNFAVIYEESDYPRPQAEKFKELAEKDGLRLGVYEGVRPNETDFKDIVAKLKVVRPDGLYLATISPDAAAMFMRQAAEQRLTAGVFGNENTGYAVNNSGQDKNLFEGIIFAASKTDENEPKVKQFMQRYFKAYNVDALPYGFYTPEAYDSLMLLAETIAKCGEDVEAVKNCLYKVQDYAGASGHFSLDRSGDAVRQYQILKVSRGKVVPNDQQEN